MRNEKIVKGLKIFLSSRWSLLLPCLVVLLTISLGCTKYEPVPKAENDLDTAVSLEQPMDYEAWSAERKLLFDIAKNTLINFSETLPQKMEWRYELNGKSELGTLDGFMVVAEATDQSSELVNKYLEGQGYIFSDYNVADGIMGGQVGYQKENTVCTVFSSYSITGKSQAAKNLSDITVKCGVFNRPIGGDKDAGGCLIGAGYSWCEAKQKCLRVWEEKCE